MTILELIRIQNLKKEHIPLLKDKKINWFNSNTIITEASIKPSGTITLVLGPKGRRNFGNLREFNNTFWKYIHRPKIGGKVVKPKKKKSTITPIEIIDKVVEKSIEKHNTSTEVLVITDSVNQSLVRHKIDTTIDLKRELEDAIIRLKRLTANNLQEECMRTQNLVLCVDAIQKLEKT